MQAKAVVQAWMDAFNRADVEQLVSLYAEDAVNHAVVGEPVKGRDAIREMLSTVFSHGNMESAIENLFEDGEWSVVEWRDALGLRGCGVFRVVGGKIVSQRVYWDQLSFLRQRGLPIPSE